MFNIKIQQATYENQSTENKTLTTIQVKDKSNGIYTNIVNTGFGTNQVIAMGVAMLFYDAPNLLIHICTIN